MGMGLKEIFFGGENEVVSHNLDLMLKKGEGGLPDLISTESMGGNAGHWNGHPCVGANFYFNSMDGRIMFFGNIQEVPNSIKEQFAPGCFHIALNLETGQVHLITIILSPNVEEVLTPLARSNLKKTMREYNKQKAVVIWDRGILKERK